MKYLMNMMNDNDKQIWANKEDNMDLNFNQKKWFLWIIPT
jgi:hypothetical protein